MGEGSYTIPMNEYYNKSKTLKEKVSDVAEDVQTNFLQKVSSGIGELDGQDQSFLEGCSAYTSAKTLYTKLTETHGKNLTNMSSFNGQNPLYKIEHNDQEFASKFNGIADGTNNSDVTARLNQLNSKIDDKIMYKKIVEFIKGISGEIGDNDLIQRILLLAKENPTKAWQELLNSDKFVTAIQKSEVIQEFFLAAMIKMETLGTHANSFSTKIMSSLANNDKFVSFLSKASVKFQDKVLDFMVKFSDDAFSAINFSEKFVGWVKNICELKPLKFLSKLANTGLGKVLTSPWTGIALEAGFSAFDAYNDKGSETYKDLGKSVTCGAIDGITSIGPLEGALIGSAAGPWGALGGFVVGGVMWGSQVLFPDWPDNVKNWAYDKVDDVRQWGESVKQNFNNITENAGNYINKKTDEFKQGIDDIGKKASKVLDNLPKISMPKLNWFG
ncbi:hypothetical protein DOK67_0000942 [Enterococcus sp. DIV0212c]|uniref:hypothetical protein n=1 Tax=Enterococcus sp. DIV0212c TaxID=2230867 RepID=UPI001A9B01D2|nr:hypothetical protein [Enterococcus sp. DIV0212c]MBO1352641.1 hypothetical protein [Enterococcus sp. DIV0212c]